MLRPHTATVKRKAEDLRLVWCWLEEIVVGADDAVVCQHRGHHGRSYVHRSSR
jgi:hypothetical protein